MISYPIVFTAKAQSNSGIHTPWQIESQGLEIGCSIPVEFEGPGKALSPEDLFAQALTNCFLATFKVFAEKSKLDFDQVVATSELTVDFDGDKKPVMKKFLLKATVSGASNPERARTIANRAFSTGFILNSVKTELALELQIL